jgi:dolichyl-diphosphooligosaccharide--protein glycosyltransferase
LQLKKLVSKLGEGTKLLKNLRFSMSHDLILQISILSIILLIAFAIRLLPMRWGLHLSEFDPYSHYRSAEYIVNKGFLSWFTWRDPQRWYPFGIQVSTTYFPGVAFTAAFLYKIVQMLALPISLYEFAVIFPLIMATLTCLVMYFWSKDTWGKTVGLFSALFLALNGSYIGRTSLGWFDDETIGILAIVLFAFLFLRSLDDHRTWNSTVKYAIAAGLSLGYMFASWGASYYPLGLTALFAVLLLFLGRYSKRLLLSYSLALGSSLLIAVNVPKLSISFLFTAPVLAALFVLSLLCLWEIFRNTKTTKWKFIYTVGFFAIISVALVAILGRGTTPLMGKFLTVLNPFERLLNPIVESVQEHRPPAWGSFYYDYGIGIFFIVIGIYFAARNPTNRNLFLVLYALTSVYFASSMVRLLVILAPSFSMLWAIGLVGVLRPFIMVMREVPRLPSRKKFVFGRVGKEFSAAAIILVFMLLSFAFILPTNPLRDRPRVVEQAYAPVTIMASSVPLRADFPILEWYDTLMWMNHELPSDTIVVSWWDYGYWLSIIGNKTTLADNGTINTTQIANIGRIFMSNNTESIKILEKYEQGGRRPEYIVVFTTFGSDGSERGYGDEGKWRWMAKIAASRYSDYFDDNTFGNLSLGADWVDTNGNGQRDQQDDVVPNAKGQNSTIYQLMTYAKETKLGNPPTVEFALNPQGKPYFEEAYFSPSGPYGGIHVLVAVYKINY